MSCRTCMTRLSTPCEVLEYFNEDTSVLRTEYWNPSWRSTAFTVVPQSGKPEGPIKNRVGSGDIPQEIKTLNLACLDENR